jgi:hypothetical protein
MKILTIIYFILCTVVVNFSQITLSESDFPSAGDTIRYSFTSNPVTDYSVSGPGITWDFSALVPDSQNVRNYKSMNDASFNVILTFGPFAPTKYRASYFNENRDLPLDQLSQFLPVAISEINGYTKSIADSITALGYSINVDGQTVPFQSDTIETKYKFPLNFASIYSSRGYTSVDFNPIADFKFKQYRNRNSQVDGYGTLITPFGTFQVLRIKHVIEETDSVYQTFFGTGFWIGIPPTITTEYEWFGNGKKDALLKIVEVNVNGNSQIRSVEYQDIYRDLTASISEVKNEIEVYPTLTEDKININSPIEISEFEIWDTQGKTELKGLLNDNNSSIIVSELNLGLHFLKLKTATDSFVFRFIKQ